MSPVLSVGMPVYNGARYLREALASMLAQTFRDFELLLVDDGSTDETPEILREYEERDARVHVVRAAHAGLVSALNLGLEAARGEFFARMDADDVAAPERFERQLDYLRAHPECVVLGTGMLVMDPEGAPMYLQETETTHERLLEGLLLRDPGVKSGLAHPSVMMRRAAAWAAGGYRKEYECAEDVDLWLRLASHGKLANLPDVLLRYRLHEGSVSHQHGALQRSHHARVAAEACARFGVAPVGRRAPELPERPISQKEIYEQWCRLACQGGYRRTALKYAWRIATRWPAPANLWPLADALFGVSRTNALKRLYGKLKPGPRAHAPEIAC